MANNGKSNVAEPNLGEINTIRDILMGQHIHHYDAKFEQLQEELELLKAELEERIEAVDQFHKLSMIDFSKESNQRMTRMEKNLVKQVESLEEKIRSTSTVDKKELGKMMANIGKRLMGE
jgi:hypothetical protein